MQFSETDFKKTNIETSEDFLKTLKEIMPGLSWRINFNPISKCHIGISSTDYFVYTFFYKISNGHFYLLVKKDYETFYMNNSDDLKSLKDSWIDHVNQLKKDADKLSEDVEKLK